AGPRGVAHRGLDEAGAGPVVQLAVGHARGAAGGGTAVADVLLEGGEVVGEEHPLGRRAPPRGLTTADFGSGTHGTLLVSHRCMASDLRSGASARHRAVPH